MNIYAWTLLVILFFFIFGLYYLYRILKMTETLIFDNLIIFIWQDCSLAGENANNVDFL